jgi:hypothetical protein
MRAGLGLLPEGMSRYPVLTDCGRAIYLDYLQHSMNDRIAVNTSTLVVSKMCGDLNCPLPSRSGGGSGTPVPVLDRVCSTGVKGQIGGHTGVLAEASFELVLPFRIRSFSRDEPSVPFQGRDEPPARSTRLHAPGLSVRAFEMHRQ